jgi:hypothetical protein
MPSLFGTRKNKNALRRLYEGLENNYVVEPTFWQRKTGRIGRSQTLLMRAQRIIKAENPSLGEINELTDDIIAHINKTKNNALSYRNRQVKDLLWETVRKLNKKALNIERRKASNANSEPRTPMKVAPNRPGTPTYTNEGELYLGYEPRIGGRRSTRRRLRRR